METEFNSGFLFDHIFEETRQIAREFYFKVLSHWDPEVPALKNEKISISEEGWMHLHKTARSRVDMLTRYFALPKIISLLQDKSVRVDINKGKDGKSMFCAFFGTADSVQIKIVLRSIQKGKIGPKKIELPPACIRGVGEWLPLSSKLFITNFLTIVKR